MPAPVTTVSVPRNRSKRPTTAAHSTRKHGRATRTSTARERALARKVATLAAKVESMERRFVRMGLAEQPTKRPAHAKGKQWGLPPRTGEVRLQVRGDDWKTEELTWY